VRGPTSTARACRTSSTRADVERAGRACGRRSEPYFAAPPPTVPAPP
jgi:hypothetical protein